MRLRGFIGPAYTLPSVNVDCQRCVNLYPEIIESGNGREGELAYLKSTPGLEKVMTISLGPIRLVHVDHEGRVLIVSGNALYKATFDGSDWSAAQVGSNTFSTSAGPIVAASAAIDEGATVFCDGTANYIFHDTGSEVFQSFTSAGYVGVPTATHVIYLDGYFIFNKADTNLFYVSDFGSFDVDPLSFASAEGDPDDINGIISNNRDLWLFNASSIEIFANTGNSDFPFERVSGGFIETGCSSGYSVAKIDGTVFWLGRNKKGEGIVYAAKGLAPQRISTHAIESIIKDQTDTGTVKAYTYQSGGHSFYVLHFDNKTLVYDLSTGLWHERASTSAEGQLTTHRPRYHAFVPAVYLSGSTAGVHLVGDYSNGKVYQFNDEYYTDDTSEIQRIRVTPHISSGMKRIFCKSLQIDLESGVGLDGDVQGSDPQLMLDWSDDGGHTWSNESMGSMGADTGEIGQYKARVIFRRLGSFRDRVFRVKVTDPVPVTFLGAELDVEGGMS